MGEERHVAYYILLVWLHLSLLIVCKLLRDEQSLKTSKTIVIKALLWLHRERMARMMRITLL